TGDLYISIGGRGTRGAVYRIRYPQGIRAIDHAASAKLQVKPHSLDWQPERSRELLRKSTSADALERLRALVEIRRFRPRFTSDDVRSAVLANWDHADRYVRKAAAELVASLSNAERLAMTTRVHSPCQQTTLGLGS